MSLAHRGSLRSLQVNGVINGEGKKRKAQDGEEDKEHSSWEETQNPPSPQQPLCSSIIH